MKIVAFVLLVVCAVSGANCAEPTLRDRKIEELVRLTGLADMLEQSRNASREQASSFVAEMLKPVFKDGGGITDEQRAQLLKATDKFMAACVDSMNIQSAVALWGRLYAADLSDHDLDGILKYYRSDLGRKDVAATQAAMPKWQAQLIEQKTKDMQAAAQSFADEVRAIATVRKQVK